MTAAKSFSNGSLMQLPSDGVIMNDTLRTLRPSFLGASLVAVVVASALVACGGQNLDGGARHAFFVRDALAPPSHSSAAAPAGCVYAPDPAIPGLLQGRLDVGVADSYQLNLLLQGSDPSTATSVTGAHVTLTAGDMTIRDFDVVTSSFIEAGKNSVAGVTAIDAPAAQALLAGLPNRLASELVIANVELRGRDPAGGSDVTSPVFSFPISVCNGCLIDFSNANDDTALPQPNCRKPLPTPPPATPCFVGQDEAVPCQLCVATRPACDPASQ